MDYLTARLHGRRSRMAEGERLESLCRVRDVPELARQLWPGSDAQTVKEIQQRLAQELVDEITEMIPLLDGSGARLVDWMLLRLQSQVPTTWEELGRVIGMAVSETIGQLPAKPFFIEAALDQWYFRELLARAAGLPGDVQRLVLQQAEEFQRSLFERGQQSYGLAASVLEQFTVLDQLPAKVTRRYPLANRAMRRNPTGLGTVVGYIVLRRVEIANLTTISEGIRLGLSEEIIKPRVMVHV